MYCPRCNNAQSDDTLECHRCGIIFAKWESIKQRQGEPRVSTVVTAKKTPLYQWLWAGVGAGILALAIFQAMRSPETDDKPSSAPAGSAPANFHSDHASSENPAGTAADYLRQAAQEFLSLLNAAEHEALPLTGHASITTSSKKHPEHEKVLMEWRTWRKNWQSQVQSLEEKLPPDSDQWQTHVAAAKEKLLRLTTEMKAVPDPGAVFKKSKSAGNARGVPSQWELKIWLTNCRSALAETKELLESQ